ncbi:hypothetical protein EBI_25849 [Enterocytozoon bieneusi H348]|nr:hypothetical protein EBI_25849 [Enterocytozoon bieneusi H348]|eukprot:XP_001827951.1 hypothetical protein EBI_25849 [Enterocytozoon bieneusi H348]
MKIYSQKSCKYKIFFREEEDQKKFSINNTPYGEG